MGLLFSAKISHWCQISHPSAKLSFQLFFSVLVSCILSFKNLTKTVKTTQEKLIKIQKNLKNKLETNINLKLEKI